MNSTSKPTKIGINGKLSDAINASPKVIVQPQPGNKAITQPIAGNMYIALEDGRLVPVQTKSPIKKLIKPSLNQKPSISGTKLQTKELPIKIVKSMSLAPKSVEQQTLTTEKTESSMLNIGNKDKISHLENTNKDRKSDLKPEKQPIKAYGKREAGNESALEPNKKLKLGAATPLNQKPEQSSKSDTDEVKESYEFKNTDEELDFSDTSFAGSAENECTTPEYLYDEILDEHDKFGSAEVLDDCEDKDDVESQISKNVISTIKQNFFKIHRKEEKICIQMNTNSTKGTGNVNKNDRHNDSLKSHKLIKLSSLPYTSKNININVSKNFHTQQPEKTTKEINSVIFRSVGATTTNYKNTTSKTPRINDRFPELPVPENINQYGDCLKTRLGRYHYGLTLNDPPCQFFQGVLKGSSGQTLAAMFGDTNLISKFEGIPMDEIGHFAIDSTFRVIPDSTEGVNHVLSINLLFRNQTIPLWYAVISCSSSELYKRILIEFQQHVMDWPFTSVLLNNDPALCKAVLALFPDIELYGSWFHYCYSIWKELSSNKLAEKCKNDVQLMTALKMLMVVPYLPPLTDTSSVTMLEGFEYVRQFVLENNLPKEFNNVLDFVASFWFNKVKSKNFTVFGKQMCSLNYIEIFQLSILSYMKPNGSVWTLTNSFQNVAKTANAEFTRFLNGKPLLTKKNRGKKFNVPIRQNMKKLMTGTCDVKTYLEKSTIYCEEMLDIFLHPLYPTTTSEKTNYVHTEGWRIKIIDK